MRTTRSARTSRAAAAAAATLVALAAGCGLARPAAAQDCGCPPGSACPVTEVPLPYTGDIPANCLETYRVFLPDPAVAGPEPASGWPVLIDLDLGGFASSMDQPCLPDDSLAGKALAHGIAVVTATASIALPADQWPAQCKSAPPGHGLFHPPDAVVTTFDGAHIAPLVPYDLPEWSMAEKDAVMLIQHVRCYAGKPPAPVDWALGAIDPHKIGVTGRSAGAMALMWAALGPDRRDEEPFSLMHDPQFRMPTRVDEAILEIGAVWMPIFAPDFAPDAPSVTHFALDGDADAGAPTMGDALPADRERNSALRYDECMFNDQLPLLLTYGQASVCADPAGQSYPEGAGPCGFSYCFDQGAQELSAHPAWSGYAWKARYLQSPSTRLVITTPQAWAQNTLGSAAEYFEVESKAQSDALDTMMANWLHYHMEPAFQAWKTIRQARVGDELLPTHVAVPGEKGDPLLAGSGTPQPGASVTVTLSNARANADVLLVIGLRTPTEVTGPGCINVHSHGGVLVPSADAVIGPLPTSAAGTLSISADWFAGLPAFSQLYFQIWITDPGAADGQSASNALQLTVP